MKELYCANNQITEIKNNQVNIFKVIDCSNNNISKIKYISKKIEPKAFGLRCSTSRNDKSLPFELSIQNGQTKFAKHSEMIKSFEPKIELVNDDEQEGMEMDIGHNGSDY